MFASLLDEVAAQETQDEVLPSSRPVTQGVVPPRSRSVPPSPSLSLPRHPRTRGLAKLAERATKASGSPLLPAGSVIHIDAEPLSSVPFRVDKGKRKVMEEVVPPSGAKGPVEKGYADARKKQRFEGEGGEARLLLRNNPVKFECDLTEAQKKGDIYQNVAEAVYCTTNVTFLCLCHSLICCGTDVLICCWEQVLECLQFLKERTELVEKIDEGGRKLAEVTERYDKSLEMAEYQVDQAVIKAKAAEARADEAEQREKDGQKERAELSQKVTDLELRLTRKEQVHEAERKGWEAKLQQAGQQAGQQALSTFQSMLPTFVRRLVQTKSFATLFAKIAEPALRLGRH